MEIQEILRPQVAAYLPQRPTDGHKGCFGRVLVIAGSRTMCGAGFLCAKSALTAGAGLVYWALPQTMQPHFAPVLPEVITLPLPETPEGEIAVSALPVLQAFVEEQKISLVVIGPGMGAGSAVRSFLFRFSAQLPCVVDAGALGQLQKEDLAAVDFSRCILTPHGGEMAHLLRTTPAVSGQERSEQVVELALLTRAVALLKGAGTLICAGQTIYRNTTGNCALAKGGSGDVLSGLIAGLWAQWGLVGGFSAEAALKAALCAVYLHGLAGDLAAAERSAYAVLAQDIIAYLPKAFLAVQKGKR